MYFALASHSKDSNVTSSLLQEIGSAIEEQLFNDYAPLWQSAGVPVRFFSDPAAIPNDGRASPLIVFDEADQPGALGYHDVTPQGLAYSKLFWAILRDNGGTFMTGPFSLSAVASHEALEAIGDPYANLWADMPDGNTEDALELCDRTQNDGYMKGRVFVSNFLGPRAFRDGMGPYDYMGLLKNPWEIRPQGYAIRRVGGPGGTYSTPGMEALPPWMQEMKQLGRRQWRPGSPTEA